MLGWGNSRDSEFVIFNLVALTSFALLFMAIFKGFAGMINTIPFLIINLFLLLIFLFVIKLGFDGRILEKVVFVGVFLNFLFGYLNIWFVRDSVSMNYNLSDLSLSLFSFFLNNIWGVWNFLCFVFLFLLICVVCFFLKKKGLLAISTNDFSVKRIGLIVIIVMVFVLLNFHFSEQIYNPYLSLVSGNEYSARVPVGSEGVLGKSFDEYHRDNFDEYDLGGRKYQYVFVFVMEQTSVDDFFRESVLTEDENFFERVRGNTHFFRNYYTSNQDSRTAIWEMFSSFFIPFESYIEPWQDYYGYILDTDNLVDLFLRNGVEAYSVSSVGGGSLILGAYPFIDFIRLYDYEKENGGYLCSTDFSYQKACEDFAIFDNFTGHILANKEKDLFYFQEMIFGHGEKYMLLSGKERVEYYNDYFNEFYSFLEDEGIEDDSLIFVLADHGPKGGAERVVSDFNIPFMVIASDLDSVDVEGYYSHLSFKDILLSYYLGLELPESEDFIWLVGQSGRIKRGYVDVVRNVSLLGDLDGDYIYFREDVEDVDLVQANINNFLTYREYVEKLSLENHTYKYIP